VTLFLAGFRHPHTPMWHFGDSVHEMFCFTKSITFKRVFCVKNWPINDMLHSGYCSIQLFWIVNPIHIQLSITNMWLAIQIQIWFCKWIDNPIQIQSQSNYFWKKIWDSKYKINMDTGIDIKICEICKLWHV